MIDLPKELLRLYVIRNDFVGKANRHRERGAKSEAREPAPFGALPIGPVYNQERFCPFAGRLKPWKQQ